MLTHQNERPHKCPIETCEYHVKGFARKYDKNRHVFSHYEGTMVCGFCSSSRSAADRSFNRTDVFKTHLAKVHGVNQLAISDPAAVSGLDDSTGETNESVSHSHGKCSTCDSTFRDALDLHEHLDECVLRAVHEHREGSSANHQIENQAKAGTSALETPEASTTPGNLEPQAPDDVFTFPRTVPLNCNFVAVSRRSRSYSNRSSEQSAIFTATDSPLDSPLQCPSSPATEFTDDRETMDASAKSIMSFASKALFSGFRGRGAYTFLIVIGPCIDYSQNR
jgi:hypothetical protein